jgi:hypothetical protein
VSKYSNVAYGGVPAHTLAGGRAVRQQGAHTDNARQALSYLPAPGEKPKCTGKLASNGFPCPNVAVTDSDFCSGHKKQAEKQQTKGS